MFDDRARTEITANERTQTERALQKLDQAFTDNRMTKAMYLARRERLVKNLERVISAPTPLVSNPAGFYDRNALNLSPRPTGYQESLATAQDLDGNMRKASESQIRQAALENATADAEAASIMDALQSNAAPNNFPAALNSVNEIQQSQLLGTTRTDFKGVWKDIADSPAVVNALRNLSESVQSRVESAMAQGMPVIAAENYIISNARNAGAILTKQGYDRGRAAEIVKSVIDGEISMVAAQNIVSADLREATSAVISNNTNYAMQPTVSPNAAKVNTEKMPISELVEVRNAALDTLADPLAFEEELDWAASFVEQANNTLNQRVNQTEVITGNSTHQVKVSTEPTKANQGDGMPTLLEVEQPAAMAEQKATTVTEAVQQVPTLQANAIVQSDALPVMINQKLPEKVTKPTPPPIPKPTPQPAPVVNLAIERAMKAKPKPVPKPTPTINQLAKRTPAANKLEQALELRTGVPTINQIAKVRAVPKPKPTPTINPALVRAMKAKPAPAPKKFSIPKKPTTPQKKPTKSAPKTQIRKAIQKIASKPSAKAMVKRAPSIPKPKSTMAKKKTRRTPAAKVANALARLPSEKNLSVPIPRPAKVRAMKTRRMLGGITGTTTSTSTSHDPDRWSTEQGEGLGASTSTTTSSRTSGAHRFEDPRIMHRWE